MNNYQIFEKQIEEIKGLEEKPKLLLHACCCPCSTHCIEVLCEYFDITVFFYNPNIDEKEEYDKRLAEFTRFIEAAPFAKEVKVIDGGYEPEKFYEMAKGREELPERSARCYDCYKLRMEKTAQYAVENNYPYFTTTLSISPYKNAEWINEIGRKLEGEIKDNNKRSDIQDVCPIYLTSDFKKKNGYKRSIELSQEYGLYRQDYCGCVFSKRDHLNKLSNR